MKEEYNSRKRKIYLDYNVRSTEDLHEMVLNQERYLDEVIDVIKDILVERHAILPSEKNVVTIDTEPPVVLIEPEVETLYKDLQINEETVRLFRKKLEEKSDAELADIIIKYIDYKPETVEAALIVSVDKGLISYDLKELLWKQIAVNFAFHNKKIKQYKWEKENAFIGYVSQYQDDEIYNIIEAPGGMVIDVYHAVLVTARKRELISEVDFANYFKQAKLAVRTDFEIRNEEINEFSGIRNDVNDFADDAEVEAEIEKYWKCPSCNELVDMELAVCWNCQAEAPEIVEHPVKEEILKQRASENPFSPFKTGFFLIVCGIVVGLLDQWRHYSHTHSHVVGLAFAALIVLFGFVMILLGLFNKSK